MPADTPRDILRVRCQNCATPASVTRALWTRTSGRLACGQCRKTTAWSLT